MQASNAPSGSPPSFPSSASPSEPSKPMRLAATIVLVRDASPPQGGVEVLLLKRAERDDANGGAWVFPGGVVDAGDATTLAAWADRGMARVEGHAITVDHVAALRECFEECGVLLAQQVGRAPNAALVQSLEDWRAPMNRGERSLLDCLDGAALAPDLAALTPLSRWVTPVGMKKRFDTRFFLARMPAGQTVSVDGGETVEAKWVNPAEASARGSVYKLLTPTRSTLTHLASCANVDDALARAKSMDAAVRDAPIQPRLGRDKRGTRPVTPDEPAYEEIGKLDPTGRGDVACTISPGVAVRLSPRVIRVTAPNASMMTGPGTNTYLVGSDDVNRWAVIDPGPDDDAHLAAILASAPGPIGWVLVTHTHRDHSPLARRLSEATGALRHGRVADHPLWQDESFVPDVAWAGGERLTLGAGGPTLAVVHTPGHASNHLCFHLEEEAMLFTGDHVMQRGTVVINPPDGDMAAYLASLRDLPLALPRLSWLAPGHGFLMAQPHAAFEAIVKHRLQREAKVLAALREQPAWPMGQLLPRVYDDVPDGLRGLARRSLTAHLLKLEGEGRARRQGPAGNDPADDATVWACLAAA